MARLVLLFAVASITAVNAQGDAPADLEVRLGQVEAKIGKTKTINTQIATKLTSWKLGSEGCAKKNRRAKCFLTSAAGNKFYGQCFLPYQRDGDEEELDLECYLDTAQCKGNQVRDAPCYSMDTWYNPPHPKAKKEFCGKCIFRSNSETEGWYCETDEGPPTGGWSACRTPDRRRRRRRSKPAPTRRRRRYNNDNGDEDWDFGQDEPLGEEKPDTHLGGIKKLVGAVVKKSLHNVEDNAKDIAKAIGKLGAGSTDVKKELKPLKEGLEDIKDKFDDAKKSRASISKKVGDVADSFDELSKVKDDIKKVATKKDVSGLEGNLKDEVKGVKDLTKRGINAVGKVATKNQKYLKAIYGDLHGPSKN